MARPDKAATVAELAGKFRDSNAAVLTEYRGLTVAQLTQLRSTIKDHATYTVVKNTLTKIAAKEAGVTAFDGHLAGPSAVVFVTGDPVEAAKGLRDFAKTNPALVIKGGVLDGNAMTADEIRQLADLESREVLLAKMAGAMKASLNNAAYLFAAPLAKAARAVDALRQKRETEGPAVVETEDSPAPTDYDPAAASIADDVPAVVETEDSPAPTDYDPAAASIADDVPAVVEAVPADYDPAAADTAETVES